MFLLTLVLLELESCNARTQTGLESLRDHSAGGHATTTKFYFPFTDCVVLLRWCLMQPRLRANATGCGGRPRTSDILASAVSIIALYHCARFTVLEIKPKAACLLEGRFYQPSHMPSLWQVFGLLSHLTALTMPRVATLQLQAFFPCSVILSFDKCTDCMMTTMINMWDSFTIQNKHKTSPSCCPLH